MIPNQKLIDGLRIAADRIEDPVWGYTWTSVGSCNCGILTQVLLDINEQQLTDIFQYIPTTNWTNSIKFLSVMDDTYSTDVCSISGYDMKEIYRTLKSFGLEDHDFETIEFLGQVTEAEYRRSSLNYFANSAWSFNEPTVVAQYFKELANKLEQLLKSSNLVIMPIRNKVNKAVPVQVAS